MNPGSCDRSPIESPRSPYHRAGAEGLPTCAGRIGAVAGAAPVDRAPRGRASVSCRRPWRGARCQRRSRPETADRQNRDALADKRDQESAPVNGGDPVQTRARSGSGMRANRRHLGWPGSSESRGRSALAERLADPRAARHLRCSWACESPILTAPRDDLIPPRGTRPRVL